MKKTIVLFFFYMGCTAIFAQNELREGDRMEAEGNYSGAEIMYRLCMEQEEDCLLKLVRLLYNEKIEPQIEDELFQLIHPLAQKGNPETQYYLGTMYSRGFGGVQQDDHEALQWLQKSADQGYEVASTVLALLKSKKKNESVIPNIFNPIETKSQDLTVPERALSRSTVFYTAGGVSIAAGVAATILLPKEYTEYGNAKRIVGKQYNLVYTAAGLVAGGVCIGLGINQKKKVYKRVIDVTSNNSRTRSPSNRDNSSRLDLVAAGNIAGLRLTF